MSREVQAKKITIDADAKKMEARADNGQEKQIQDASKLDTSLTKALQGTGIKLNQPLEVIITEIEKGNPFLNKREANLALSMLDDLTDLGHDKLPSQFVKPETLQAVDETVPLPGIEEPVVAAETSTEFSAEARELKSQAERISQLQDEVALLIAKKGMLAEKGPIRATIHKLLNTEMKLEIQIQNIRQELQELGEDISEKAQVVIDDIVAQPSTVDLPPTRMSFYNRVLTYGTVAFMAATFCGADRPNNEAGMSRADEVELQAPGDVVGSATADTTVEQPADTTSQAIEKDPTKAIGSAGAETHNFAGMGGEAPTEISSANQEPEQAPETGSATSAEKEKGSNEVSSEAQKAIELALNDKAFVEELQQLATKYKTHGGEYSINKAILAAVTLDNRAAQSGNYSVAQAQTALREAALASEHSEAARYRLQAQVAAETFESLYATLGETKFFKQQASQRRAKPTKAFGMSRDDYYKNAGEHNIVDADDKE